MGKTLTSLSEELANSVDSSASGVVRVEGRREKIVWQLVDQLAILPVQRRIAMRVRTFHIGEVACTPVQQRK